MKKNKIGGLTNIPLEEWMALEDGSCTYANYLDNPNYEEPKYSEQEFNNLKALAIQRKRNAIIEQQLAPHREQQAFMQWVHGNAQEGHTYQDYVAHQANQGLPPLTEVEFNDIANNPLSALGPSPPMRRHNGGKSKKYRKRHCKKHRKKSCKKYRKRSYRKY